MLPDLRPSRKERTRASILARTTAPRDPRPFSTRKSGSVVARPICDGGCWRFGRQAAFGMMSGRGAGAAQPSFAFFDLGEQDRARVVREFAFTTVADHYAVALVKDERGRIAQRLAVEVEVQVIAAVPRQAAELRGAELHAPYREEVSERVVVRVGGLHV